MGLLDEVLCSVGGGAGTAAGGVAGPGAAALVRQLATLLGNQAGGSPGGLAGLATAFEQGGLGHIFASWLGTGPNLPISAQQLEQVLGSGAIAQLAAASGVNTAQAGAGLAQLLPLVLDRLTPHGQLPAGSAVPDLAALARQLLTR